MAISVIHNPSDNKLRSLVQMLASRFLQRGAAGLSGTLDLSSLFSRPFLRLSQQLTALIDRSITRLL